MDKKNGRIAKGNAPSLRAGYRRHKSGLKAAAFREKSSRCGGVYL